MKKKRNLIILAILLLAVGFAAVTTILNLNGGASVGTYQDEFDVYFSNATEKKNNADAVENKKVIKDDTHIKFITNMNSIGDTYVLTYDVTNGSKNYDAQVTIECVGGNDYIKVTNEFDDTETLKATETRTGKLTIEVIKSYASTSESDTSIETNISCTIKGNAVERTERATGTPADKVLPNPWKFTEDNDGDNEISVGDLITMSTESFYVYDATGDNIKAIAQYNLAVEGSLITGLQNASAGKLKFDTNGSADYEASSIKKYVDTYVSNLNKLNGQISSSGLITMEEIEALGCEKTAETGYSCPSNLNTFVYSVAYWTSTKYDDSSVWGVTNYGSARTSGISLGYSFGVRPVITISKSLFE